ncbi:MAG: 16S rRNA (uracil(1498)-N(3))-methyltransferase [Bacteroidales bacterium]|jgi:16S rRNA (uracil1498-N3)-methyltransferase|nr:16S rRNA (uracil(1498)-N(3))-methyltransferase [Bacteroidales bacterium]
MADTLFYCPDILISPRLPEQESQHCIKVLRMKEGDRLTVTDGRGTFYNCSLIEAHPKHCVVSILHRSVEERKRDYTLHIAFGPTKQMDRNEWFVEKATEIGTDLFTPILSSFSERREIKRERLEKIAVSAMKQSQQAFLPVIEEMVRLKDLISRPFNGRKFIAHCYDLPREPLAQTYRKGEHALILIGPEGDFSREEVESAIANGFEPVTLGETRLRTETACLAATHTIHVINQITSK